jgi:flagellar biosynthesis protein FliQ
LGIQVSHHFQDWLKEVGIFVAPKHVAIVAHTILAIEHVKKQMGDYFRQMTKVTQQIPLPFSL